MHLRRITDHAKAQISAVARLDLIVAVIAMGFIQVFGSVLLSAQAADTQEVPTSWSGALEALENKNWDGASAYFQMRVDARPNAFIAYRYLGEAYHGGGDYSRALKAHFIAAAYSQGKSAALYNAARTYAKLDQPEMSLRWLDQSLKEGYDDISAIREDADLEVIREDPRFEQMLLRAAKYRNTGMPVGHTLHQSPWDPGADDVQIRTIGERLNAGTGGVSVGADGNIYVGDFGPSIFRMTPDGELETIASDMKGASGNFVDEDGSIVQAQFFDRTLVRVAPDGEKQLIVDEGLSGPVGVAKNAKGEIFIANCDSHHISVVRADGAHEVFSRSPLYYCPNGIAFDDRGDLYVANYHDGVILRVTPDGVAHYVAVMPGESAGYLAFAGNLFYVTAREDQRVYKLTRDGDMWIIAGSGVRGDINGDGKTASFSLPNGLALSANENCLYTNDNHRDWRMGANKDAIKTTSLIREIRLDPKRGCDH